MGVHQDGLIHISELADKFVKNPADVVKVHQKVTVTVLEVDLQRKRISLSMKSGDKRESVNKSRSAEAGKRGSQRKKKETVGSGLKRNKKQKVTSRFEGNPFYEAFKKNGVVD